MTFVNQTLGETWQVRGEAPEWRRLYDRRENYPVGVVPAGVLLLTAGVDVQKDRVEIYVWGWGRDRQCWLIDHIVLMGNPYLRQVWDEASEAVQRNWLHASGLEMRLAKVGADTGFATTQVESWARRHPGLVIPVKGANTLSAPIFAWSGTQDRTAAGKKARGALRRGMVGGHLATLELYGFLALDPPTEEDAAEGVIHPAGFVHLNGLASEEVCKQLVGDQWLEDKAEWKPVYAREALDCWKYARAVFSAIGADRWAPSRWRALEQTYAMEREPEPPPHPEPEAEDEPAPVAPPVPSVETTPKPKARYAPRYPSAGSWFGR